MVVHSLAQIVNTVAKVVGEDELQRVARKGAYWSSCFWRSRNDNPIYLWAYHHIRALDIWHSQGRSDAVAYLHKNGIYD